MPKKIQCVCGHAPHVEVCKEKVKAELVFTNAPLSGEIELNCGCADNSAGVAQTKTYEHRRRKFCSLPFGCTYHYRADETWRFYNPGHPIPTPRKVVAK